MPNNIAAEIEALHHMATHELAEKYEELHGRPTRTRHRAYLIRKIAWRIQANAEGDLTERARKRAAELANDAEVRVIAPKTLICTNTSFGCRALAMVNRSHGLSKRKVLRQNTSCSSPRNPASSETSTVQIRHGLR